MTDNITITGLVATVPRNITTNEGLTISSFRLASAQRRFDRTAERWIDVDTNWYTITAFRQLGMNCAGSIDKGDRVLVTGRLRIREWDNGERTGTTIDIEADAIGHDLSWGTSKFSRTISTSRASATNPASTGDGEAPTESWANAAAVGDEGGAPEDLGVTEPLADSPLTEAASVPF
ncbi:single-strand DNA-binding protein [Salinibacterium sp. CAN_S4]|uniref:single-stranded DNA-binding protein n=1 Tax=Salinibacterium sp. CAN_S4 TaxID=2787727 RepID=UPI0018F05B0E